MLFLSKQDKKTCIIIQSYYLGDVALKVLFGATLSICKIFTFLAVSPFAIHKVLQMFLMISIGNNTLMTILSGCWSAHYFYSSSHKVNNTTNNKTVQVALGSNRFELFNIFSFTLYLKLCGPILNLRLQQGQVIPNQFRNISHCWHRFCPLIYLPELASLIALYCRNNPLQDMTKVASSLIVNVYQLWV